MSRLPPELVDKIIDHLQNSHSALRACSLTCRNWFARARYHLFWTVHVGPDLYEQLMGVLSPPGTPNIGLLARHLIVTGRRFHGGGVGTWTHDDLGKLLEKMPHLVCLTLDTLEIGRIEWLKLGPCLPDLKILDLCSVRIDDPTTVPTLFTAFPKLCDVECDYLWSPGLPGPYRSPEAPTAATLTHLNVKQQYPGGDSFVQRLLEWLFAHKLHTKLRVLQINGLDAPSLKAFSDLVADIGPDLRKLGISFDKALSPSVETTELVSALKRCTNLRTFELLPLTLYIAHPWVCALLESIPQAELRWVNVSLTTGGIVPADYANIDFAGIAQVLAEFPKLQQVAFRVAILDKEAGPRLKEHILGCMAPLKGRARVSLAQAP